MSGAKRAMPVPAKQHPEQIEPAPRRGEGDRERAGELESYRDPERQPVEGLVEAEVHPREDDAEEEDVSPGGVVEGRSRRSPDRKQDDRREQAAEEDGPPGAELVEERRRQG